MSKWVLINEEDAGDDVSIEGDTIEAALLTAYNEMCKPQGVSFETATRNSVGGYMMFEADHRSPTFVIPARCIRPA